MILSVDIRAHTILGQLRFDLAAREILAVTGPSGCGKTTLLNLIDGLGPAAPGAITWQGVQRPRIGHVFQEPRLLPWRTVRQNLALVAGPGEAGRIDALLEELGLGAVGQFYPGQISLGMARRSAIARAFAVTPDLLLLDEPFVSLDEVLAARGRDLLLHTWQRHPTAIILVTHDLVEAASLADRVLLLGGAPTEMLGIYEVPAHLRRAGPAAAIEVAAALRRSMG
jgi:NitT/TauT family transport system ATP-binding protein